jgi:protein SCO1/2
MFAFRLPHNHPPLITFLVLLTLLLSLCPPVSAQLITGSLPPQVVEKLGATIPLDLTFNDELGRPVTLRALFDKPTILTLVYLRCPNICSPLLHELARVVDAGELRPGPDYRLVTVSFDPRETPELARTARDNLLASLQRPIPPDAWRFLTGDPNTINQLAAAVGFQFKRDQEDYVHPTVVMFLARDGKIVRYLFGLELLPANLKMALIDASQGRPRSFMHQIQRLCFTYDPARNTYIFKINRLILAATALFVIFFLLFLLLRRRKPQSQTGMTP